MNDGDIKVIASKFWWKYFLIGPGLCISSPSPLHRLATQHFNEGKQSESFLSQPRTHHLGLKAQNFESTIFAIGCFSLKAVYNSYRLQRLLQVAKFLYMNFLTHANIIFLFRHLPTEIVIFINVCYQMKCFRGDSFSFFGTGFANIPPNFLILCEVQTRYSKILKYSEQYIRDHLSGTKVRIWIGSEYDAVFNFSCIASCNLTKTFTFFCMSFLS